RDQWSAVQFHELLNAFVGDRDYAAAARIASHMLAHFDAFPSRRTVEKLTRELAGRGDDWTRLALPTPSERQGPPPRARRRPAAAEWQAQRGRLGRSEAMEYLLERLRLLNCFQGSQPGGLGYVCTMHAEPEGMSDGAWRKDRGRREVINPYVELQRQGLGIAD